MKYILAQAPEGWGTLNRIGDIVTSKDMILSQLETVFEKSLECFLGRTVVYSDLQLLNESSIWGTEKVQASDNGFSAYCPSPPKQHQELGILQVHSSPTLVETLSFVIAFCLSRQMLYMGRLWDHINMVGIMTHSHTPHPANFSFQELSLNNIIFLDLIFTIKMFFSMFH